METESNLVSIHQSPILSIVTPVFNEQGALPELISRVRKVCEGLGYEYEHVVIDNCSTDLSFKILRDAARHDQRLKVIENMSNYGHIRSPVHGMLQASGDAVVVIPSDLQTPPEVIPSLVEAWQAGAPVVLLQRVSAGEGRLMAGARNAYYWLLKRISHAELIPRATGEGLYDRRFIETLREINDPNPFVRGLVSQLGFPIMTIPFEQQPRRAGSSKNSWGSLIDIGLLGVTSLSRTPLRVASSVGFISAFLSILVAIVYLVRKLIDWNAFELGLAPLVIGIFFLGSIQLIAVGLLGEYVGNIFTLVQRHPLVVERERLNFTNED